MKLLYIARLLYIFNSAKPSCDVFRVFDHIDVSGNEKDDALVEDT